MADNRKQYSGYDYRSNLAYDYSALERQRIHEIPRQRPQIRTISRPKVSVRPAERISVFAVAAFAAAAVLLGLVLYGHVQLMALSNSVVSLQEELSVLQSENVQLTAEYERAFDLETVEAAALAAGMSKPSSSQIYYLDMTAPDSASVYTAQSGDVFGMLSVKLGDAMRSAAEYFS